VSLLATSDRKGEDLPASAFDNESIQEQHIAINGKKEGAGAPSNSHMGAVAAKKPGRERPGSLNATIAHT